MFDQVRAFSECLAAANVGAWQNEDGWMEGGVWGYVDAVGKTMIPFQYSEAFPFHDGLACVRELEKSTFGFINHQGVLTVPAAYDQAELFSEGLALVRRAKKAGFVNTCGSLVIPMQYDFALAFREGMATVRQDQRYFAIDQRGDVVLEAPGPGLRSFREGVAEACDRFGRWGFLNKAGEWSVQPLFKECHSFSEGMAAVRNEQGWGFVDHSGLVRIPCTLPEAGFFHGGVARIRHNGKYGLIDTFGNWVVEPCMDFLSVPSQGYLSFRDKSKWGFMNLEGQITLPAQYEGAMAFSRVNAQ
jgi:hypothetical protein